LKIAHLVRNHTLAKSISDASWGLFLSSRSVLWHARLWCLSSPSRLGSLPRSASLCGFRVKNTLSMRTHGCPSCGLVLDRDEHAALNILAAALAVAAPLASRRAGGNGFRFAGTHRFGTDRLYGCVRKGTRHSGWMNEESPRLKPGGVP